MRPPRTLETPTLTLPGIRFFSEVEVQPQRLAVVRVATRLPVQLRFDFDPAHDMISSCYLLQLLDLESRQPKGEQQTEQRLPVPLFSGHQDAQEQQR